MPGISVFDFLGEHKNENESALEISLGKKNNEQIDMFFAPYYRIVNKEKEFNANFKK